MIRDGRGERATEITGDSDSAGGLLRACDSGRSPQTPGGTWACGFGIGRKVGHVEIVGRDVGGELGRTPLVLK